ncbi:MAG: hypothetical protein NO516_07020 [Candidatus Methanomethylicia archaeon]|uniref:Uncharacterized protein n=1 Tax=Candidatus Methanomethylicus mesodigestus TaxID=1867258 RepID=A0A7C3EVU8_9CREN|nr:hypothetical protein [Candidatus Methanomethylicia archaeon]
MGKVKKGEVCSVQGCANPAIRSLSPQYSGAMKKAGFKLSESKRLFLCEEHYKAFKKAHTAEERLERWRQSG